MSDVAYHYDKMMRGFDHLIDLWGADHHGYIKRCECMLEAWGWPGALEVQLEDGADAGVGVLHVVHRVGGVLLLGHLDIEVDGLVGRAGQHEVAGGVHAHLVDELLEGDENGQSAVSRSLDAMREKGYLYEKDGALWLSMSSSKVTISPVRFDMRTALPSRNKFTSWPSCTSSAPGQPQASSMHSQRLI